MTNGARGTPALWRFAVLVGRASTVYKRVLQRITTRKMGLSLLPNPTEMLITSTIVKRWGHLSLGLAIKRDESKKLRFFRFRCLIRIVWPQKPAWQTIIFWGGRVRVVQFPKKILHSRNCWKNNQLRKRHAQKTHASALHSRRWCVQILVKLMPTKKRTLPKGAKNVMLQSCKNCQTLWSGLELLLGTLCRVLRHETEFSVPLSTQRYKRADIPN